MNASRCPKLPDPRLGGCCAICGCWLPPSLAGLYRAFCEDCYYPIKREPLGKRLDARRLGLTPIDDENPWQQNNVRIWEDAP